MAICRNVRKSAREDIEKMHGTENMIELDITASNEVRKGERILKTKASEADLLALSRTVKDYIGHRAVYDIRQDLDSGITIYFPKPMRLWCLVSGSCRYLRLEVRSVKYRKDCGFLTLVCNPYRSDLQDESIKVRAIDLDKKGNKALSEVETIQQWREI